MRKLALPITLVAVTACLAGLAIYTIGATAGLKGDVKELRSSNQTLKTQVAEATRATGELRTSLTTVESNLDDLQDEARDADQEERLAADAKSKIERAIMKKRVVDLQKYSQVSDWKVSCVVATSNTLSCVGKGFLDGDESNENYEATVDSDGAFVWKQSY